MQNAVDTREVGCAGQKASATTALSKGFCLYAEQHVAAIPKLLKNFSYKPAEKADNTRTADSVAFLHRLPLFSNKKVKGCLAVLAD